jgi:hypothetical protein
MFLTQLDDQYKDGICKPKSIIVASLSDASRILAPEPQTNLESLHARALTSQTFKNGTVKLFYVPLANPEVLAKENSPGFVKLQENFNRLEFNRADLDDGWAINAYDALTTVTAAVNTVPITRAITPSGVNTAIRLFSSSDYPVPLAAQEPLFFDNNGNRSGSNPVVVQVCPATGKPPHSTTVEVYPIKESCK